MASDIDRPHGNVTGKTDVVISDGPSPYEEIDRLRAALETAEREQSSLIVRAVGEAMRAHDEEVDRLGSERDEARAALETAEQDTLDRVEVALRAALSQTGDTAFASAVYIVAGLGGERSKGADDGDCTVPECHIRFPRNRGQWCAACKGADDG